MYYSKEIILRFALDSKKEIQKQRGQKRKREERGVVNCIVFSSFIVHHRAIANMSEVAGALVKYRIYSFVSFSLLAS